MDEATQQNASMVDAAASAAQSMYAEADNLSHAISVFKLSEQDDVSDLAAPHTVRALGMLR